MHVASVQKANLLEHYIQIKKTFLESFFLNLSDEKRAEIVQEIHDKEDELDECREEANVL